MNSWKFDLVFLLMFLTCREIPVSTLCLKTAQASSKPSRALLREQMKNQRGVSISFFINVLSPKSVGKVHLRFVAIKIRRGTWKASKCHRWPSHCFSWMGSWVANPLPPHPQHSAWPNRDVPGTPSFCYSDCASFRTLEVFTTLGLVFPLLWLSLNLHY